MQNKTFHYALMALILLFAVPDPGVVWAQNDFASTAQTFTTDQLTYVPRLIAAICYAAGIFLIAAGVLKLKEHAEDPRSVKISHGLARLFAGVALMILPTFTGWVVKTIGFNNGTSLSFVKFGVSFSK